MSTKERRLANSIMKDCLKRCDSGNDDCEARCNSEAWNAIADEIERNEFEFMSPGEKQAKKEQQAIDRIKDDLSYMRSQIENAPNNIDKALMKDNYRSLFDQLRHFYGADEANGWELKGGRRNRRSTRKNRRSGKSRKTRHSRR